jgi:hypothetical protein
MQGEILKINQKSPKRGYQRSRRYGDSLSEGCARIELISGVVSFAVIQPATSARVVTDRKFPDKVL